MRGRYARTATLLTSYLAAGSAFGHADHVDRAAWMACETAALADACEYTDHHDAVYRGTCRLMSETLLCVRNEPIERRETSPEAPGS